MTETGANFSPHLESFLKYLSAEHWRPAGTDIVAEKQHRLDAFARAQRLVVEAGK
jgi:hypothetical protein